VPGLEEEFGLVGRLQAEHVLLLVVVDGFGGNGVVHPNGVVQVVVHLALAEPVLVFMQVHNHVSQRAVKHFPAPLPKRCCNFELFELVLFLKKISHSLFYLKVNKYEEECVNIQN
jgi:hypothetical protein